MKAKYLVSGLLMSMAVTACADHSGTGVADVSDPTSKAVAPLALSGSVFIRQRIALPPDAALTVTLSDASSGPGKTKVLAQQVQRLEGKQAPFHYVLPLNDVKFSTNSNAFLSAAITLNGKVIFASESLQPIKSVNAQQLDLTLIPVPQTAVPVVGQ